MREKDIMHECGAYWVCAHRDQYTVYRSGVTHSTADSAYSKDADGISIAIARCEYLATRDLGFPKAVDWDLED